MSGTTMKKHTTKSGILPAQSIMKRSLQEKHCALSIFQVASRTNSWAQTISDLQSKCLPPEITGLIMHIFADVEDGDYSTS